MSDNIILKVENLLGYYRGMFGVVHAVDGVSFSIEYGDIVAIAGESGCGKSSLAELLTGYPMSLLHYEGGQVYIRDTPMYELKPIPELTKKQKRLREKLEQEGKEIPVYDSRLEPKLTKEQRKQWKNKTKKRKEELRKEILCKEIGFVPQASLDALNPVKRIKNFILDVMKQRIGDVPKGRIEESGNTTKSSIKQEALNRVIEHFSKIGLDKSVLNRYPHELSGGMKQRTVIGISTLWNPNLLIVDEPTSALDVTTQKLLLETFLDLKKKGILNTILIISHDIPTLNQICNKGLIMYAGRIVESGTMDELINDPIHPYTDGLIHSIASFNPDGSAETELIGIPGRPPNLRNPPIGCRFYARCTKRLPKCKDNYPPHFYPKGEKRPVACWLYER